MSATATKPSIDDVRRMATSRHMHGIVNAYLMAKANAQLWRERVEPIQRDMLRLVGATYADKWGRKSGPITDPKDSWLMGDDHHREWCAELDIEYRSRGWLDKSDDAGVCPALKAEELERLAARAVLLGAGEYVPHLQPDGLLCADMEAYRKGLDLTVGLVVNHPTFRSTITERGAQ